VFSGRVHFLQLPRAIGGLDVSKIKKTFIIIGVTVVLCAASFFTGLFLSRKIISGKVARIELELQQSNDRFSKLQNSIRDRAEKMDRDSGELIEGLKAFENRGSDLERRARDAIRSLDEERAILETLLSERSD